MRAKVLKECEVRRAEWCAWTIIQSCERSYAAGSSPGGMPVRREPTPPFLAPADGMASPALHANRRLESGRSLDGSRVPSSRPKGPQVRLVRVTRKHTNLRIETTPSA